jgi:hypothetical protein
MPTRDDAVLVLVDYAGLDKAAATALLEAVVQAAEDEILDTLAGTGPMPTAMADVRALRLRRICERAGRLLTRREIEVVFRVAASPADTIDRKMRSTYPQAIDEFMRERVRQTATVENLGRAKAARYRVTFDDTAGFESAQTLLGRAGLTRDVRAAKATLSLDLPAQMNVGGTARNPLDTLGLKKP